MTIDSGVGPSANDVANTLEGSKYLNVADADRSFISEAGLRCELALDSKTTLPVLTSIRDTDGLLSVGEAAMRANTVAALAGSNAEAVEVAKRLTDRMAVLNPKSFFIRILPF
jgi:hypothetical protein